MTQEQIEAVREQLQRSIDALAEPLDEMALAALDTLTKANEELRAEVERLRQKYEDCDLAIKARQILLTEARATIASLNEQCDNADAAFAAKDALIDRLTKERDEASLLAASYLSEWQTMRTRLSAMQEAIAEAVRRADTETPFKTHVIVSDVVEPLRPFATKPEPEVEADAMKAERYRHVKRGSFYTVIGEAELQVANSRYTPGEGDTLVIYRAEDGKLWAREYDEFHDGRFQPEPEADPLVDALREVVGDGYTLDKEAAQLRTALATRGGRVVFDGSEG